nr:hypothetical protein [Streptococcus thermophilus]
MKEEYGTSYRKEVAKIMIDDLVNIKTYLHLLKALVLFSIILHKASLFVVM